MEPGVNECKSHLGDRKPSVCRALPRVAPPLMPDIYPCPECGNEDTEWSTAAPTMRVCPPPKGCGYAWRVIEGPINSESPLGRCVVG